MNTVAKKIILLGNEGVGKTSLTKQFVYSIFSDEYMSTIGIKISKKEVELASCKLNLMIWDIAGNMLSSKIYKNYLKGAAGVIFVFDLSRPETYHEMIAEYEALNANTGELATIIIGNKLDLVENKDVELFNADFLTSAKNNVAVEESFQRISELMTHD